MIPSPDILLSIVIPAYNEERRLPGTLDELVAHCRRFPFSWEVIVVVERSTDQTVERASEIAARHEEISVIVNQVKRGKGYALRTGVGMSSGEIVLTMDADLSVPAEFIDAFVSYLEANPSVDVLVGNRRHPDTVIEVRQSRLRQVLGHVFSRLVRVLSASALTDTQCGFKALRRNAAMEIYARQTVDGFACDVETLLLAERLGFVVRDLPVRWANSPESKVRIVRDSLHMLWDVLRIRWKVSRSLARTPFRAHSREEAAEQRKA
ncbi:MAG: dolichyl-phosphate beta-glucosyltransferase [Opitutaceae bacterium]